MISLRIKMVLLTLALCSFELLNGQSLLPVMYDSTLANHQVNVVGNLFQHSTRLNNELSRKFIFGGTINDELSQKVYENQSDYNRVGFGGHIGIEYRAPNQIFKSKPNWSWMVNVSNEVHGAGEYSNDLFGLVFIGNAPFLGGNASFTNTSGRFEQFLSIGGGIHDRKTKSFLTLNAILPQQFFELSVNRGSVAFSESGDQIDLRFEGEVLRANSYAYFKGMGAAVNFDFNLPFGNSESFNGVVSVVGRNLGAYQIHNADFITIDTEQSFTGFSLNELLEEDGVEALKDSLNVSETNKSEFKMLPGFLQVGKVVLANSPTKVQSFFGVRMYTNRVYRPLIYAGVHYQPINQFSVGAHGSFGGYGNFRLGLYANYVTKQLLIGLGTEDVLGAIFGSQYGHSGLIRLAWKI